jgi:hypothetical protein
MPGGYAMGVEPEELRVVQQDTKDGTAADQVNGVEPMDDGLLSRADFVFRQRQSRFLSMGYSLGRPVAMRLRVTSYEELA